MKLHIFTPGDLIIRHGEIAREMYLITHGRIEVISETGKVLKELATGDFFGEIGILSLSEGQNRYLTPPLSASCVLGLAKSGAY